MIDHTSKDFVLKGAGSTIITQATASGNFITVFTAPLFPLSRGYSHINSTDVGAKWTRVSFRFRPEATPGQRSTLLPKELRVLSRVHGELEMEHDQIHFPQLLKDVNFEEHNQVFSRM